MGLFTLEHGTRAYRADFIFYGSAVTGLAGALVGDALLAGTPAREGLVLAGLVGAGALAWTGLEYLLHRFVLHGLPPFSRWHAEHHRRPQALICAPTLLTAALFVLLIFLPAWWLAAPWHACALTLGVLAGYLGYAITHHAIHHWPARSAWLRERKHWHSLHHRAGAPACYGVSSGFWDRALGTVPRR
jgi:sterol desaturase/sphingolipid hydroxylase (fatty acid hydroxylase superfamily)